MIYPVIVWFKKTQYDEKIEISIANFVENTSLNGFTRPMESLMTKDQNFSVMSS